MLDVLEVVHQDIVTAKTRREDLSFYIHARLQKSTLLYTQELQQSVDSLVAKSNLNVLNRM